MKRTTMDGWVLGLQVWALLIGGGCSKGTSATAENVKSSGAGQPCPASEAMVSDGESSGNQLNLIKGRNGRWYTFVDGAGSTVTPTAGSQGGTFTMAPGGVNGSLFAAHMTGQIGHSGAAHAGMGFDFADREASYDALGYQGLSFWAKKGPGSSPHVRLNVPDRNTDPRGKVCTVCFNDFGLDLTLTDDWARYVVSFSGIKPIEGWGSPRPAVVDSSKIYGLKFQVNEPGAAYDVWVDEVEFTGCAGPR